MTRRASPLTVIVDHKDWRSQKNLLPQIKAAAIATLKHQGVLQTVAPFTLLLSDDEELQALNKQFRAKDKPTNVLSFPAGQADYLGDIAIAYGMTAREAAAEGKAFSHHACHLAVHGVLHLLGFDHERASDARKMQPLEIAILKDLGIADPYSLKVA